jgi:hypothetical protein
MRATLIQQILAIETNLTLLFKIRQLTSWFQNSY